MQAFTIKKAIEYCYLALAWFSAIACLVRTDYNFTVALFGYYFWVTRPTNEKLKPLMYLSGLAMIIDFIWLVTAGSNWNQHSEYEAWNANASIRAASFSFSIINFLIKGALIGLLFLLGRTQAKDSEPFIAGNQGQSNFSAKDRL